MPLFVVVSTTLLLVREHLSLLYFRKRSRTVDLRERVILAGTPSDIHQLRHTFTPEQIMEIAVVEEIDIENQPIADLNRCPAQTHSVDRVIFAGGHSHLTACRRRSPPAKSKASRRGWPRISFAPRSRAPDFDVFGNRPMLVFRTTPDLSWALSIKGLIDRIGALVGLLLTSWLFVIIAIGNPAHLAGPHFLPPAAGGKEWPALHHVQVSFHGIRRRDAPGGTGRL